MKRVVPLRVRGFLRTWFPGVPHAGTQNRVMGSIEEVRATLDRIRQLARQGESDAFHGELWAHADSIRAYLHSFVLDNAGSAFVAQYVNDALPRFLHTLRFLPLRPGLRLLELGSNPYLFSLLVKRFLDHETHYANFFAQNIYDTSVGSGTQQIWSAQFGEKYEVEYRSFNLELSDYPYPDESFDAVLFCEILEHLVIDPLAVFPRLRRLLRRGGLLLLTTPNAVRMANIALMLAGRNFFDRYHPEFTVYGRHNREFTAQELVQILEKNNFEILEAATLDRYDYSQPCIGTDDYGPRLHITYTRAQLEAWLRQIGASLESRGDNLYVLARRPEHGE